MKTTTTEKVIKKNFRNNLKRNKMINKRILILISVIVTIGLYSMAYAQNTTAGGSIQGVLGKTPAESKERWVKADNSSISGKVTDETGAPLAGVNVVEKGTTNGTMTDADGNFSLQVANENSVLVLTSIGYVSQEITAGGQSSLNISMQPDVKQLEDVVVVGYGTQVKKNVVGAIAQVTREDLGKVVSSDFAQQLAGKAAGVVVNTSTGLPGAEPQIFIRGVGTLTAGKNPLIVVDGFPLTEGSSINSINPTDIESLDILKDPASAAIYGSRAANGVILIKTREAPKDKMQVTFEMYTGVQQRSDNLKYVDAYEAAELFTEARDNGYVSLNPAVNKASDDAATRIARNTSLRGRRLNYLQPYLDKQSGLTNTDWYNEIFRTTPIRNYSLGIAGSGERTKCYASINYFDQEGIASGTNLKRYSNLLKLESKITDRLTLGAGINSSYSLQNFFQTSINFSIDPLSIGFISYPFFKPYNDDGSLRISEQIKANTPEDGPLAENPAALAKLITNLRKTFRTFGSLYLEYEWVKNLKFKTLVGGDFFNQNHTYYNPSFLGGYRAAAPKPAQTSETSTTNVNYLNENTLNYSNKFGLHDLNVLAGYTFQKETGTVTTVVGTNIPDDNIRNIGGASSFSVTKDGYTWALISYLARIQYSYNQKYLLSLVYRRDGSSRFGSENQWGNFPSVSVGWIISEENFFSKSDVVTYAKLRTTWGFTGNNQIGNYSAIALVNGGAFANYAFGNNLATGFAATTAANSNLTWETKTSYNMGLDFALFNTLKFSADYYSSITKDLLLNVPVPAQSGYSSFIENIGRVQNRGLELEISTNPIKAREFTLGFSANVAMNKNKVLALAPGQTQIIQGSNNNFYTKVGSPIAEIYGYNVTGVFKSNEEINHTTCLSGTQIGDYIVNDTNGDSKIDTDDYIPLGNYNPKATWGFNTNIKYKNVELSFGFNGVIGRSLFNYQMAIFDASGECFSVPSQYYADNCYSPDKNPDGFFAMPNTNFSLARKSTYASNRFVESGDYIRLRNLRLTYTLPKSIISKVGLHSFKMYITGNNVFTILKKFHGFNPESTSDNVLTGGFVFSNYPIAESWLIGFNFTF